MYTLSLGFVQVFKGEGMPHFGSRSTKGDLFVEYNVILPLEVSPETRRSKSFRFTIHPFLQLLGVIRITDIDVFSPSLELIEVFQPMSSTHDEL